jgi:hypothetical protein
MLGVKSEEAGRLPAGVGWPRPEARSAFIRSHNVRARTMHTTLDPTTTTTTILQHILIHSELHGNRSSLNNIDSSSIGSPHIIAIRAANTIWQCNVAYSSYSIALHLTSDSTYHRNASHMESVSVSPAPHPGSIHTVLPEADRGCSIAVCI